MNRYLLNTSYIGSQFRGVQKIICSKEPYKTDDTTIQGNLEIALHKLRPLNPIHVICSSRTDTGVHAIQSTFHVDLLRSNGELYETNGITTVLNTYFNKKQLDIRIKNTFLVPNTFHCRYNVKARTYIYKLAIAKDNLRNEKSNLYTFQIPIENLRRRHFICCPTFDIEKFCEASKLFLGCHDFRTFMAQGSKRKSKITRRNMEKIDVIKDTYAFWNQEDMYLDKTYSNFDYWNVVFKSSGFLYNQIRRIVGTLIAVAQNKVTSEEVQCMLQVPSHLTWNPRIVPAPSHGLYLWQVEYSSHDLKTFK